MSVIQFGQGKLIELDEAGAQIGEFKPELAPAPAPLPAAAKVVGRIGKPELPAIPSPNARPKSYRVELQERRKSVAAQVRLLRHYERELSEIDRMLAATKTTARKKPG